MRRSPARWLAMGLGLAGLGLLGACASLPQFVGESSMFYRDYRGPEGRPDAALMRLSADGVIRVTPASTCADFNKPETGVALFSSPSTKDYSYLHNRRLGVMGEAPAGRVSTEIALAGGQPVVLSFTRNWVERGTGYVCQVHRSLVPEPGVYYQLEAAPVFAEGKCLVAVSRLSEPAALVVTEPAKLCGAPR